MDTKDEVIFINLGLLAHFNFYSLYIRRYLDIMDRCQCHCDGDDDDGTRVGVEPFL